jgi:hypothetical protein
MRPNPNIAPASVAEQVAPVVWQLRNGWPISDPAEGSSLADGIDSMAREIDALRARLRLVALAFMLLAVGLIGAALR